MFDVGDRVRVKNLMACDKEETDLKIGDVGVVKKSDSGGCWVDFGRSWPDAFNQYPEGYDMWNSQLDQFITFPGFVDGTATELSINKKGNMLNKLTSRLKRVLNQNLQALYRIGWIDGDLELTREGGRHLLEVLLDENEEKLAKVAREKIAELEE